MGNHRRAWPRWSTLMKIIQTQSFLWNLKASTREIVIFPLQVFCFSRNKFEFHRIKMKNL